MLTLEKPALRPLWTSREVAKLIGCCARHVENQARAGRFPAPIQIGKLRRWRPEDVDAFIEAGRK
jgi:excisionase family DNA binding protein